MRPRRYFRLIMLLAGASVSAQLEYRVNFLVNVASSILASGGALFGLSILFSDGQRVGGWTYREAIVVVGLFTLVEGFIATFLQPNLSRVSEAVRTGTMDFTLLKPIDSQFLVSAREVNIFRLSDILIGLGLMLWAVITLHSATPWGVALGIVLILAGLVIVYAIWFILTTTAFWFVNIENLTELFHGLFGAGQFPVTAFPGWTRIVFSFVVPVAFITTVPAEAFIGRADPARAVGAAAIALFLFFVARWFWKFAVRSYTSASS
ncbi:MAG: transporter permease [Chloroflexi bacterium]|nr:transporter permease [Chloroflexota bacterium]